jgi:hypothetical protein
MHGTRETAKIKQWTVSGSTDKRLFWLFFAALALDRRTQDY